MALPTIENLDLDTRRVFLRADLDVPMTPAGGIADPARIEAALPTIRYALDKGARLILASHLGQPQGRVQAGLSLEPIGVYLAERLGREIVLADEPAGDGARKVVNDLREGQVALLENLAFVPGEESGEEALSRALASYADVYVNDAFCTTDRVRASTVGMVRHLSEKGIGFLFARELDQLSRLTGEVARPLVALLGGSSLAARIGILDTLLDRVDTVLVGGALANTLIKARGGEVGRSLVDEGRMVTARTLLKKAHDRGVRVILPRDVVAGAGVQAESGRVVPANAVPDDLAALDIGPEAVAMFSEELRAARTVFWNGPMGVYEAEPFATGTLELARTLGRAVGTFSVVVGDDTVSAIGRAGVADRISHLSRGGPAALAFLQGQELPGLIALQT